MKKRPIGLFAVLSGMLLLLVFTVVSYTSSTPMASASNTTPMVQVAKAQVNPCTAKANPCNPCAAKNPCAANPCAAKMKNPCNPCAAKNPCAAGGGVNPKLVSRPARTKLFVADQATLIKEGERLWNDPKLSTNGLACQNCHVGGASFNPTFAQPYPHPVAMPKAQAGLAQVNADEMIQFCLLVPMASKPLPWDSRELAALTAYTTQVVQQEYMKTAATNPCAAKKTVNPCNPCAAKTNPCAAKNPCNPCAAKMKNPCNPCAAQNPCNPCGAKVKNPCNPCGAKKQ